MIPDQLDIRMLAELVRRQSTSWDFDPEMNEIGLPACSELESGYSAFANSRRYRIPMMVSPQKNVSSYMIPDGESPRKCGWAYSYDQGNTKESGS